MDQIEPESGADDASRPHYLDYNFFFQDQAARLEHQQQLALAALKGLTLVNGGAIVSLFTFIAAAGAKFDATSVWWSFVWFVGGLVANFVAYLAGYFAQANFMNFSVIEGDNAVRRAKNVTSANDSRPFYKTGNKWLGVAIVCAVLSLGLFALGSGTALSGVLP